jgi:hypothetical protein
MSDARAWYIDRRTQLRITANAWDIARSIIRLPESLL